MNLKVFLLALLLIPSSVIAETSRVLSHSGGSGRVVIVKPEKKEVEQREDIRAMPSLSQTEERPHRKVYLSRGGSGSGASHVVKRKERNKSKDESQ